VTFRECREGMLKKNICSNSNSLLTRILIARSTHAKIASIMQFVVTQQFYWQNYEWLSPKVNSKGNDYSVMPKQKAIASPFVSSK